MEYAEAIRQQYTAKECREELATHAESKAHAAALWAEFTREHGAATSYNGATVLAWLGYKS